jgi:arylsulfatase A-like enzyme
MDLGSVPMPLFKEEELKSQLAFSSIDHQTKVPQSPYAYDAKRMVAAYHAQIHLIDDQVGRMLDALDETGQRKNTIVIFTSDHGEMLGDHGLRQKGCRFYEGAVHVPLIISWPGHFKAGVRSNGLVELTDLVPTLLDVLGLPISKYIQGKSLLPILTGDRDAHYHRDFVRCEYHDTLDQPYASHANMIRTEQYKLVVYHGHDIGEIYDLQTDPNEFRNLWAEPDYQTLKFSLMKTLFDAVMLAVDEGVDRVGRF